MEFVDVWDRWTGTAWVPGMVATCRKDEGKRCATQKNGVRGGILRGWTVGEGNPVTQTH